MTRKPKAIALMSGGLDSALAARIVKDQGVEVVGLHLVSPFGCKEDLQKVADSIGISMIFKDKGESYLDLVKNPRYGYGKNMNPCIDCRIFMFQLADVVRQDIGADFIITGEVIGQRPMSQQRNSMELIDSKSPLGNRLLRPLSAHSFPPTLAEEKGWVDREKLFDISGRGRKDQLKMAEELGLTFFSAPGGGCLLTDAQFSSRLKDFFDHDEPSSSEERMAQSAMLRLGRHFRFSDSAKAIVARNNVENEELRRLNKDAHGTLLYPFNFDGPIAILFGKSSAEDFKLAGQLIHRYGKSKNADAPRVGIEGMPEESTFVITSSLPEDKIMEYRL